MHWLVQSRSILGHVAEVHVFKYYAKKARIQGSCGLINTSMGMVVIFGMVCACLCSICFFNHVCLHVAMAVHILMYLLHADMDYGLLSCILNWNKGYVFNSVFSERTLVFSSSATTSSSFIYSTSSC